MKRAAFCLYWLFASGMCLHDVWAETNVWEKTIAKNRRLVVSRKEIVGDALARKIEEVKRKHPAVVPDLCYAYSLGLYEGKSHLVRPLWQRDDFAYTKSPLATYQGPLETQFLDICYNESNGITVLLFKHFRQLSAEIAKAGSNGIEILSASSTNALAHDLPFGPQIESGGIDCTDVNHLSITLKKSQSEVAVFAFENGSWRLRSSTCTSGYLRP